MKKLLHASTVLFLFLFGNLIVAQAPSGYTTVLNHNFGTSGTIKNVSDLQNNYDWGLLWGDANPNNPWANAAEWQKYTTLSSNNYAFASNHLKIIARFNNDINGNGTPDYAGGSDQSGTDREITSGCLRSKNTYKPTTTTSYYFETRMKVPSGKALWPAFWLYRKKGGTNAEIDIVEIVNNQWDSSLAPNWNPLVYHNNVHFSSSGDNAYASAKGSSLSTSYHIWACEWTDTQVKFHLDNNLIRTVSYPINDPNTGWGNSNPANVLINLAAGGGWPGDADDTNAFPATLEVDFLKVYKKGDVTPPPSSDIPTYTLENNKWHIITLPADPGNSNTVNDIFGDDIPGQIRTDWAIFNYNANKGEYDSYGLYATLKPGIGYWIIQKSGSSKVLDMPAGSTAITAAHYDEVYLHNKSGVNTWNMVGNPYPTAISAANIRIKTGNGVCASGCDLNTASSNNIVNNQFWSYDGSKYITHSPTSASTLNPWTGFWAVTLKDATSAGGPFIHFYKSTAAKPSDAKTFSSSPIRNMTPPGALANDLELNSFYGISSVSPNPSKGIFNFNFSSAFKGEVSFELFSIDGRKIESIKLQKVNKSFTHQLNISNKASGIYFVQFEAGAYQSNHKIIKN